MAPLRGWFVYLDVFGFSALVEEHRPEALAAKLVKAHDEARKYLKRRSRQGVKYFAISDSICVTYPVNEQDFLRTLEQCIEDISRIMSIFVRRDLPLRGGVSFGKYVERANIVVGIPVLNAVGLEKLLPFPLVIIPAKEIYQGKTIDNLADWTINPVSVKIKNGLIRGALIYPEELDIFLYYVDKKVTKHATDGPPEVAAMWETAFRYVKDYVHTLDRRAETHKG